MAQGIDHIVLCVRDLNAAREHFRALGFTLTPPATHPFGTANSLAQMNSSFVELLSVADAMKIPPHAEGRFSFAAHNAAFLARGEGMSMLVLSSEDARADEARWRRSGLTTFEPIYFERSATLPDGFEATVAFTISFVMNEKIPDVVFFSCQQHAPEAFWQPSYQQHANGAADLDSVTLVVERPRDHEDFFQALLGSNPARVEAGTLEMQTALGNIEVISPDEVPERFPGFAGVSVGTDARFAAAAIRVADLELAEDCLSRAGIAPVRARDRIMLPPSRCFGLTLELVEIQK